MTAIRALLAGIAEGRVEPLYLVRGDRVLAEPAATALATELGGAAGCEPVWVRRPDEIAAVVADLRTFSLFSSGKVTVVVESGALADRTAAAELFDDVRGALPFRGSGDELGGRSRDAALRLLQILRLFELDPAGGPPARVLSRLPATVFAGKSGRAGKAKGSADETRAALEPLLEAALAAGLRGIGESESSVLADLLADGLPPGHSLVLVESSAAEEHPIVAALAKRGAIADVGEVRMAKGKFSGLEALATELRRATGVSIAGPAIEALARRTLRTEDRRRGGEEGAIEADTTARFAGEYRKLAALAGPGGAIDVELVEANVEDRGEEDPFALLDAVTAGKAAEALARIARKIAGAEDPMLERLGVLSQLVTLSRRLAAMRSIAAREKIPFTEGSYKRFEANLYPRFTAPVPGVTANPLAAIRHPFPMFKLYQAAGRIPAAAIERLPALALETERRLKGDSGEPDAALTAFVLAIAKPV